MAYERYSRHVLVVGAEGQKKLRELTVLVAGVGGLGCFEAYLLACLGVGKLVLVDDDTISLSDLNRQVLYTPSDIGQPKVEVAARRLKEFNPDVDVKPVKLRLSRENILKVLDEADIVIDGLDNWETRMLVDEAAYRLGIPYIHAGVQSLYGQVYLAIPGKTPCLRCIMPERVGGQRAVIPAIAPMVSLVASIAVNELVKLVTGVGRPALGELIVVDGYTLGVEKIKVKARPNCTC